MAVTKLFQFLTKFFKLRVFAMFLDFSNEVDFYLHGCLFHILLFFDELIDKSRIKSKNVYILMNFTDFNMLMHKGQCFCTKCSPYQRTSVIRRLYGFINLTKPYIVILEWFQKWIRRQRIPCAV